MHIGALIFPTDLSIGIIRLARELEDRGFESLWVTEHTHIPTSRRSPWPGGAPLPEEYKRTLDPYVGLTAAASVTRRLKVGTGVSLIAQHHPITLAKTVASLDLVSEGRFLLGIGVGWNEEEMEDHGVEPSTRRSAVRDTVLAMKELWTKDEASYSGRFVNFESTFSWPKPVQTPHPPVLMGGAGGPITFKHIAEYCDGWMPIHGRRDIADKLPALRQALHDAGRTDDSLELGVFGCPGDARTIDAYAEMGVSRCVLGLPPTSEADALKTLDAYAAIVEHYASSEAPTTG